MYICFGIFCVLIMYISDESMFSPSARTYKYACKASIYMYLGHPIREYINIRSMVHISNSRIDKFNIYIIDELT